MEDKVKFILFPQSFIQYSLLKVSCGPRVMLIARTAKESQQISDM